MTVTGIDYLTGETEIPVSQLRFVEKGNADTSALFPETEPGFAEFAGVFVNKYGVAESSNPPVVLTETSLSVVRSFYDSTGGAINRVDDSKANKCW